MTADEVHAVEGSSRAPIDVRDLAQDRQRKCFRIAGCRDQPDRAHDPREDSRRYSAAPEGTGLSEGHACAAGAGRLPYDACDGDERGFLAARGSPHKESEERSSTFHERRPSLSKQLLAS